MPDHRPPPPPSVDRLRAEAKVIASTAERLAEVYSWLYPSGYTRSRREDHERTRRNVSGATGTLADGFDELDTVRRHLGVGAENILKALALLRGAERAFGRAQTTIDRFGTDSVDPGGVVPSPEERVDVQGAQASQRRRAARAEERPVPWARQEVTG